MHMHVIEKRVKHKASEASEHACFRTNNNHATNTTSSSSSSSLIHSFIHSLTLAHALFLVMAADADVV